MEKKAAKNDIEETAIAKWRSSRHQQQKRETAQDITSRSAIQLKTSATKARYSSRHQQQKRDAAQDISNRSMIQLKTSATDSPLHGHIFPFINTNCVLRGFPAFFVGDPLSVYNKNFYFSPSWAQIPLHKHKFRFSSFFCRGSPSSFTQKPFLFPFIGTYSPS